MNGVVIIWQLARQEDTNEYELLKAFEYNICLEETITAVKNPMFHIQSLQLRLNNVIVGTRSGDIYFLSMPNFESGEDQDMRDLVKKVYTAHDNEIPKEADFSAAGDKIYCITSKGMFTSWDYATMRSLVRIPFGMPTTTMIVLNNHDLIIIAFEKKVVVLDVSRRESSETIDGFTVETQFNLTDVKVSLNEEFMAIAIAPSEETNAKIELYTINFDKKEFISKKTIEGIFSEIEFMDFSTDNYYLMYKDSIGQKCFFDLANNKKNDTLAIDFDIEWVSEGIKISEKRRGLDPWYRENNNVTNLVRAGKKSLIATDEIGTVSPTSLTPNHRSVSSSTLVRREDTTNATATISTSSTPATLASTTLS